MNPDDQPVQRGSNFATPDPEALKIEINTLMWMHLPGSTTLYRAEEIAGEVFDRIWSEWTPSEIQRGDSK